MNTLRTKDFVNRLEHERIVEAIRDAESQTSAEIRVYIQRGELDVDPVFAAQRKFRALGMDRTAERNGVLIFVAPRARKFAVFGDEAIHLRCGEDYWRGIVDMMGSHFHAERFSDAIVDAVREVGQELARHFPNTGSDTNELPDDVVED